MDLKRITPDAIALCVSAFLLVAVGVSTDNGGFTLAGGIMLVVGALLAWQQARGG